MVALICSLASECANLLWAGRAKKVRRGANASGQGSLGLGVSSYKELCPAALAACRIGIQHSEPEGQEKKQQPAPHCSAFLALSHHFAALDYLSVRCWSSG